MMRFVKAHACGNDFLLVEENAAGKEHAEMARALCARNTGIGADGIEFIERRAGGEFFLRLFNADGGEAELSGNGTRCVAAWLAESEGLMEVALGTHGGMRPCRIVEARSPVFRIESGMGVPRVMPRTIELPTVGEIAGAMVNVGNPHFVVFVESADFSVHGRPWQEVGERISTSPLFKHGTNVEFVQLAAAGEIEFRIFERGCGPTMSSGTGTCASAAAAMMLRGAERSLVAMAEGGAQSVMWPRNDEPMLLTGAAEIVCTGETMSWPKGVR